MSERYAIFGDIHGNLEALEAVLEKFKEEKPDRYICIGDIVGYGADPSACIQKVRELNPVMVAGNHDFATAGILSPGFFNLYARESIYWTIGNTSEEEREFLRRMKLVDRIDGITVVHSNLDQPETFEYIQTSYDVQLGLCEMEGPVCFVGHSHVPVGFTLNRGVVSIITEPVIKVVPHGQSIINVGSVGQPRDEDPRATYAIYDPEEQVVRIKRVEYPIKRVQEKMLKAGLPGILAERLKFGR